MQSPKEVGVAITSDDIDIEAESTIRTRTSTSASDPQQSKAQRTRTHSLLNGRFALESLALLISAALLIAIVAVLATYNGTPQPNWSYMSLNALISWLSTASRGLILYSVSEGLGQLKWVWFARGPRPLLDLRAFDFASRGPYGALRMIWRVKGCYMAALGCGAVILALGFDPFAQNLIAYQQRMVQQDGDGSGQSAQALVANVSMYDAVGFRYASNTFGVDPILKSNVYNSVFNSDRAKPWSIPQYICPSANCTWAPIASLEAVALCSNITTRLSMSCIAIPENTSYAGMTNCTVSLPKSNLTSWFLESPAQTNGANKYQIPMINGVTLSAVKADLASVYTNASMSPIQFITPRLPNNSLLETAPSTDFSLWDGANDLRMWDATECAIEPVVRASRPSVTHNVFSDETLDIAYARTWVPEYTYTNTSGAWEKQGAPGWHFSPPSSWKTELGIEHDTYIFGAQAMYTLEKFLEILFSGQFWRDPLHQAFTATNPQSTMYAAADVLQAVALGDIAGCGVELAGRLACAMRNVAGAISKSWRDSVYIETSREVGDFEKAGMARGRVLVGVTFVVVHWQWICLPVLVWALGIGVLLGVVWRTGKGVPRWRNDPLPLLFVYDVDADRDGERLEREILEKGAAGSCGMEMEGVQARLSEKDGYFRLG
ncbi:DUF3176 domain-containing protein [Aspergillus mulundensis]|uniref:Uncharacterized protein n=1 Tax=Aspergillus mulundensis TaxID=1810919 RepID=A0A3D8R4B9_9EURO|nr:hypothetical protein DSM5745_08568 [Aspergillus mulundensis]RDW68808.1 hypothetical protein DSM5745_08568 [Aspergillus mulundensis]